MPLGNFLVGGPKIRDRIGVDSWWFQVRDCLLKPETGTEMIQFQKIDIRKSGEPYRAAWVVRVTEVPATPRVQRETH